MHGAHDVQVAQGVVRDLVAGQRLGDDTGGPSARGQCGVGDHAHQAHRGAAVDELDATLGHGRAEARRGRSEGRIRAGTGAAEDAERLDGRHAGLPSGTGSLGPPCRPGPPDAAHDGLGGVAVVDGEGEARGGQGKDPGDEEGEAVARDVGGLGGGAAMGGAHADEHGRQDRHADGAADLAHRIEEVDALPMESGVIMAKAAAWLGTITWAIVSPSTKMTPRTSQNWCQRHLGQRPHPESQSEQTAREMPRSRCEKDQAARDLRRT